jgi:hypothetical protein
MFPAPTKTPHRFPPFVCLDSCDSRDSWSTPSLSRCSKLGRKPCGHQGTTNHAKRTNKRAEQNTFVALDGTEQPERGGICSQRPRRRPTDSLPSSVWIRVIREIRGPHLPCRDVANSAASHEVIEGPRITRSERIRGRSKIRSWHSTGRSSRRGGGICSQRPRRRPTDSLPSSVWIRVIREIRGPHLPCRDVANSAASHEVMRGTTNHAKRTNKRAEQNTFVALDGTEQPERGGMFPAPTKTPHRFPPFVCLDSCDSRDSWSTPSLSRCSKLGRKP